MPTPLVAIVFAAVAAAQQPSIAAGGATFRLYCSECHGRLGRGGRGPDLVSGRWTHGGSNAEIARTIAKGVAGAGMPAFGDQLDEADIQQIVAFIRSLAAGADATRPTGNPERGQEIFWGKGNCGTCHMVAGRGGRLGPELTRIGAQRSVASLMESIKSPSAAIAEGFQSVCAIPKGGRPITGIRVNEDNFTIQIFDASERYHSLQKSSLDRIEELSESLMPASGLSSAEVEDVVAYMDTLRGKQ